MAWKDKASERAYRKRWLEENKESYKAYQRAWYAKNKARVLEAGRAWRKANPERGRAANKRFYWRHRERLLAKGKASWRTDKRMHENCRLQRKYGITVTQYEQLASLQGNLCACCGRPERALGRTGRPKPLSVDHKHTDGTVRGLLCSHCNVGIGNFFDDPGLMRKAIAYLERSSKCH